MRAKLKCKLEIRGRLARVVGKVHAANDPAVAPRSAWPLYEARKAFWIASHPKASPEEYGQAMLRIAKQCGL